MNPLGSHLLTKWCTLNLSFREDDCLCTRDPDQTNHYCKIRALYLAYQSEYHSHLVALLD